MPKFILARTEQFFIILINRYNRGSYRGNVMLSKTFQTVIKSLAFSNPWETVEYKTYMKRQQGYVYLHFLIINL